MKQKLLPIAATSLAILTTPVLAGEVAVYGKLNLAYTQLEEDQAGTTARDNWDLESFASRLGFRGSEDITDNLQAIFKLEYEVQPEGSGSSGDSREFKARNSYVGLQGSWGTLVGGKHDTPLKLSQGKVDVFNDYRYGDIGNSIPGERRDNDIILYSTPKIEGVMSDFSATLGIMPGEDSGADNDAGDDDSFADQVSAAVTYNNEAVYLALAVDNNVDGLDIIRISASLNINDLTLGAMYQQAEDSETGNFKLEDNVKGPIGDVLEMYGDINGIDEQDSRLLSAKYNIDSFTLKAQYIDSSYEGNNAEFDNSALTLGVDYHLSKRTKLYSYYSELTVDESTAAGLINDYEYSALGLIGVQHKF